MTFPRFGRRPIPNRLPATRPAPTAVLDLDHAHPRLSAHLPFRHHYRTADPASPNARPLPPTGEPDMDAFPLLLALFLLLGLHDLAAARFAQDGLDLDAPRDGPDDRW